MANVGVQFRIGKGKETNLAGKFVVVRGYALESKCFVKCTRIVGIADTLRYPTDRSSKSVACGETAALVSLCPDELSIQAHPHRGK